MKLYKFERKVHVQRKKNSKEKLKEGERRTDKYSLKKNKPIWISAVLGNNCSVGSLESA